MAFNIYCITNVCKAQNVNNLMELEMALCIDDYVTSLCVVAELLTSLLFTKLLFVNICENIF